MLRKISIFILPFMLLACGLKKPFPIDYSRLSERTGRIVLDSNNDGKIDDSLIPDDLTISNITQITTRPITSLSMSNYKIPYSGGGGAPLELSLGAQYYIFHSNGATGTPYFGPIVSADIPAYSLDPDIFSGDSTDDDKIPAELINAQSMDLVYIDTIPWDTGGIVPDGTQCAAASAVQINSGPYEYTIVCADNDASSLYGHVKMPDGWLVGTGTHDGSNNAATLSDSGASFTADTLIGLTIYNTTDGSSCEITDNDSTTITCTLSGGTDNDWDTNDVYRFGDVTFTLQYIQTAADTNALQGNVTIQCRGTGETVNNTWETEVAMDDAAVTGSNAVDHLTSGAVSFFCNPGDTLYWRYQVDASGTTTAMATLNFIGMNMKFRRRMGD